VSDEQTQPAHTELATVKDLTDKDGEGAEGPKYKRLTLAQEAQIVRLAAEGLLQTQIAEAIGCSQSAVSRVLSEFTSTIAAARTLLEASALQASKDWVSSLKPAAEKGDHKPAKELLQAVGVVQRDGPTGNNAVQVIVGAPGNAAMPDPFAE
jgi:transcriptional regulator with XRE-family HTH domain